MLWLSHQSEQLAPDTDFGSLFHLLHHRGIADLLAFIVQSTRSVMNPQQFWNDPADIWTRSRINPEMWIWIVDQFQSRLVTLAEFCTLWLAVASVMQVVYCQHGRKDQLISRRVGHVVVVRSRLLTSRCCWINKIRSWRSERSGSPNKVMRTTRRWVYGCPIIHARSLSAPASTCHVRLSMSGLRRVTSLTSSSSSLSLSLYLMPCTPQS